MTERALERKGIIADRCEINRQIRADNALLRKTVRIAVQIVWRLPHWQTAPELIRAKHWLLRVAVKRTLAVCYPVHTGVAVL